MIKKLLAIAFLFSCNQPQKIKASKLEKKSLVVCSQNLARFGEDQKKKVRQLNYLVQRMSKAACSVVALQEIYLKRSNAIHDLAQALSKKTGRKFQPYVGKSRDRHIANGFLVSEDVGRVVSIKSYWSRSLPRINPYGPARNFARGPVLIEIDLAPNYQLGVKKRLEVISIHLKSKHNAWKDPAKMNFEIDRIESAEAIRQLVFEEAEDNSLMIVLGDRNNAKDTASDEVLEGKVLLSDLYQSGQCKLTKNEVALCQRTRNPSLIGLFGLRLDRFPGKFPKGSYLYRGKESLLDEAFIRPEDLSFVTRSDNSLGIGYQGEYFKGSDHKLLYLEFR